MRQVFLPATRPIRGIQHIWGIYLTLALQYRERLREVIVLQLDDAEQHLNLPLDGGGVKQVSKERLSLWGLRELAAQLSPRSSEGSGPLIYSGPPRVLEIGCGDGTWCFKVKEEQPDWIVEGIDDTDHVRMPPIFNGKC